MPTYRDQAETSGKERYRPPAATRGSRSSRHSLSRSGVPFNPAARAVSEKSGHDRWVPEPTDELRRQAVLLAYQGEQMSTITARLGASEAQVQEWIADMAGEARSARSPARLPQPADRRALARTLLESERLLTAGGPEEEDAEADVFVFFNDLAAHEFYDLVERSVDVVSAVEGVDRAWHADRELICVLGGVAPATLADVLVLWWREQLTAIVGQR